MSPCPLHGALYIFHYVCVYVCVHSLLFGDGGHDVIEWNFHFVRIE